MNIKKLFLAAGALALNTAAFAHDAPEPVIDSFMSDDCEGRRLILRQSPIDENTYDLFALFGRTMNAVAAPGESDIRSCLIEWNIDLPNNLKFNKLHLVAEGRYSLGKPGFAYTSIDHIADFDRNVFNDVVFDTRLGDEANITETYEFDSVISRSQLSPSARKCGADIEMYTALEVEARADSRSRSDSTNTLRKVSIRIENQEVVDAIRLFGIELVKCR